MEVAASTPPTMTYLDFLPVLVIRKISSMIDLTDMLSAERASHQFHVGIKESPDPITRSHLKWSDLDAGAELLCPHIKPGCRKEIIIRG